MATNPVDVMTHVAARFAAECGVPSHRVFGSGTTLDTARFRSLLGAHCGSRSAPRSRVRDRRTRRFGSAHLVAGHDWRNAARIVRAPPPDPITESIRQEIDQKVRRAAYTIISGKGATYYGIGSALARIVDVILHDQRSVMTACLPTPEVAGVSNVTLSLPRLIGGKGVLETFPLPLNEQETIRLRESAQVIRQALNELEDKDSLTKTAS